MAWPCSEQDLGQSSSICSNCRCPLQAFKILLSLLQRPDLLNEHEDICSLLQVSHSFRAAVQQACLDRLSINIERGAKDWNSKLLNFIRWLEKHADLVSSVSIQGKSLLKLRVSQHQFQASLLGFSLQSSRDQFKQPMQQSSDEPDGSIVLTLPPASVTSLIFYDRYPASMQSAQQFGGVLSQLTSLQQLSFYGTEYKPLPSTCIAPLAGLQQLTSLDMGYVGSTYDLRCLPSQLQHLSLSFKPGAFLAQPLHQIVGHLHCLQQLVLETWDDSKEEVQRLAEIAPCLSQLQKIKFTAPSYYCLIDAKCLWPHLSSLRSLEITDHEVLIQPGSYGDLLQSLVTATSLTRLHIEIGEDIRMCGESSLEALFSSLTNLQELTLYPCCELSLMVSGEEDLSADGSADGKDGHQPRYSHPLANLTKLTKLAFFAQGEDDGMDDGVFKLLTANLTNLRDLSIGRSGNDFGLYHMRLIGRLIGLTRLSMAKVRAASKGLRCLTGLKQLATLYGFEDADLYEVEDAKNWTLEDFWASIEVSAADLRYEERGGMLVPVGRA